jgi:steroid delta-isomerase-like uncharacterized protein
MSPSKNHIQLKEEIMKRWLVFLPLVILITFTLGCRDQNAIAELQEMKAQAQIEKQNIDVVTKFVDELNNLNADIYDELCAPDYVWYFPSNSPNPFSRDQEKEYIQQVYVAFPDISWAIEDIFAADDRVVARFTARGTHENEYQGIPATGKKFDISGFLVYRLQNGKLIESREEADVMGMMNQLGMELRPASVAE